MIYVHIPFCKQKCSYCDFHFSTSFSSYRQRMVDALCSEIQQRRDYLKNPQIETIYLGGGTPSLLTTHELSQLTKTIYTHFDCTHLKEFTLEANPEDISPQQLEQWQQLGVNRLSIGIQSLRTNDLSWMNRIHSVEQAKNCVQIAIKSGINNISVDLMYGLPELSNNEWNAHLLAVVNMGVKHISAYCLTVEPGTALNTWIKNGKIIPTQEDTQAEQFLLLVDLLEKHGFIHYEISNFCLPNYESIHNSNYWTAKHYLGIGPSAHSYNGRFRSWNVRNNHRYMNGIERLQPHFESEQLSLNDQYNELILTGLRTMKGVDLDLLAAVLPIEKSFFERIDFFCRQEQMEYHQIDHHRFIRLTKNGRLQADRIASELFR